MIASPGYHGSVSGMVKNALDYAEDLRHDERPYLEDRAVGLIAVAHGWQTAVGTLNQLRQVVHALRGWPAPLGVAINDSAGLIGDDADTTIPPSCASCARWASRSSRSPPPCARPPQSARPGSRLATW